MYLFFHKPTLLSLMLAFLSASFLWSQSRSTLSLPEAYELTEKQYPILKNGSLLDQLYQIDLKKLDISQLPTIELKADGRIQSEVTQLPGEGLPIQTDLPLYSIKTFVEANYTIYDGGIPEIQKELKAAQLLADQQSLEVEKYSLRNQINQLFLGTLLLREQIKLLDITLEDLDARKERVQAGVTFGTVLESEVSKIKVRSLEIEAEKSNLISTEKGLVATLEALTGEAIDQTVRLELPDLPSPRYIPEIKRPEQTFFQLQKQALLANEKLLEAARKPKLGAYVQAGVGYPNPVNFLDDAFAPFAIGGVRFQWAITDWDKQKTDTERLTIAAQQFDNQQETFEYKLNTLTGKYLSDLDRLEEQIEKDREIADLQATILQQLAAQLEGGVITSTDYINQANLELAARQKLELHKTQLLQVQLDYLNSRGGF